MMTVHSRNVGVQTWSSAEVLVNGRRYSEGRKMISHLDLRFGLSKSIEDFPEHRFIHR